MKNTGKSEAAGVVIREVTQEHVQHIDRTSCVVMDGDESRMVRRNLDKENLIVRNGYHKEYIV